MCEMVWIFKAILRPAMLYGIETIPLNMSMMKKMGVQEIRMLRWEMRVMRKDKV